MTAATRTGARAKATKAPARPKPAKKTQPKAAEPSKPVELPATPLDIQPPPGLTVAFTPGRRWAMWLATVGNEHAAQWVNEAIADGIALQPLCVNHFVPYTTVRDWIAADPARAASYAHARQERADKLADEIVAIADEIDVATRYDGEDVKLALDPTAVARNRLRVDARKWVAAKLKPGTYGDKLDVTQTVSVKSLSDEQLAAKLASLGIPVALGEGNGLQAPGLSPSASSGAEAGQ